MVPDLLCSESHINETQNAGDSPAAWPPTLPESPHQQATGSEDQQGWARTPSPALLLQKTPLGDPAASKESSPVPEGNVCEGSLLLGVTPEGLVASSNKHKGLSNLELKSCRCF